MITFLETLNEQLYGKLLIYILIGGGVYFTFITRFIQFRYFSRAFKAILAGRTKTHESHISAFQAFCTSAAARVGTGNLAGVAIAIYLGGPGAIFWMWVVAIIGMVTSLSENILAQLYKTNNGDGTFNGGPAYYIEKALGYRWLGIFFSFALIIAYGFAFSSVQSNSIAAVLSGYGFSNYLVGGILIILSGLIIFGGIRSIAKTAEKLVPFMAVSYVLIALIVVIMNFSKIPGILELIVVSAFGIKSVAGGAIGAAIINGVKRGLFSNEAGIGTTPNAAATAFSVHPVNQGLLGMVGVFIDTIVICTATAIIVLLSGLYNGDITGVELTQAALSTQLGSIGQHIVSIAIFLFGFTSIIANYYYGETSVRFITKQKHSILAYRIIFLAVIFLGTVSQLPLVWNFADFSMGIMALINMFAILSLSGIVASVVKDYDEQVKQGVAVPVFNRSKFSNLDTSIDQDIWQEHNQPSTTKPVTD